MLKTSRAERGNKVVLTRINNDRELIVSILRKKYLSRSHIMRNTNYKLLQLIIEGEREIDRKKM